MAGRSSANAIRPKGSPLAIPGIKSSGAVFPYSVENAVDFELPDHEGKAWRLADHLARGPVLLVFYRGDW